MGTPSVRLSLNTSLKEAMIFEDSDDDCDQKIEYPHLPLIKEEKNEESRDVPITIKQEHKIKIKQEPGIKIKQEPEIKIKLEPGITIKQEPGITIKQEPGLTLKQDPYDDAEFKIKHELKCPLTPSIKKEEPDVLVGTPDLSIVKQEPKSISSRVADMVLRTPVKLEDETGKMNCKSAKRTLLRQRNSPYAKTEERSPPRRTPKKRISCEGLEDSSKSKMSKKKKYSRHEQESDPEVLARRQKQIDFGKNTIGYDNYIKMVPREKRASDDPMTPNKYRSYSRRGFDGLIKQWRLKLHNYD